jgi:hypothetical protein
MPDNVAKQTGVFSEVQPDLGTFFLEKRFLPGVRRFRIAGIAGVMLIICHGRKL